MCTVSWFREPGGYRLFFNRDELRTRRPATPPVVRGAGRARYVAPLDGDHGGTWLAVNDRGLSLGLLNGYGGYRDDDASSAAPHASRGGIIPTLIDSRDPAEALDRLPGLGLERFRSFWLFALSEDASRLARWQTGQLTREALDERDLPLVSSSFDTGRVRAERMRRFRELERPLDPQARARVHLDFHRSHLPERGPYSPCMHRPDAHTVSFSRIRTGRETVCFDYRACAPCRSDTSPQAIVLHRR